MPNWLVPEQIYDLPRNIAFLDTNVLVSLANPNDEWHDQTIAALDMGEYRWAVALGSLIEAWNFLVGRVRRKEFAYDLMSKACELNPAVHVATYDTRDFLRLFGVSGLSFHVYDMRDTSSTSGA
jgi:hypothetical protein